MNDKPLPKAQHMSEYQYIVCRPISWFKGRFWPQGWSKTEEEAREQAQQHKQVLCKLTIIEDYSGAS